MPAGMITGRWEEKETGRKRRYYHLTRKGGAALREKVRSWSELCRAVSCVLERSDGRA